MKYYLHDSNSFNDEKITELFISFGYEGLGLFYTILEKLAQQEKPIKTNVLKAQLKVGKKLQKCWEFMESIELISSNNGETFNKQLINFSGKYAIKKENNKKRISEWRKNQELTKNVTCYESVCNDPKVNKSKVNESKQITNTIYSFDEFWETYNKKTGRANCERIYARLKDKDYAKIKETLPIYLERLKEKDKKYQMNPQTYLNGKHWEDEIYLKTKTTEPTPSVPYEGFNPLSIDLSKLKPLR